MIKDHLLYSSTFTASSPFPRVGRPGLKQKSDRGSVPDFSASETELMTLPNSSGPKQLRGSEGSLLAQCSRLPTTDDSSQRTVALRRALIKGERVLDVPTWLNLSGDPDSLGRWQSALGQSAPYSALS